MRRAILIAILVFWAVLMLFLTDWMTPRTYGAGGDWYGTTLAMVEVRYPNVVTLAWTNPPDLDLDTLRFVAMAGGDTIRLPDYMGRKETENAPYELRPGMPDSIWVTLPCRTVPVDWSFWMYAVDTAGNVSGKSNIADWRQSP